MLLGELVAPEVLQVVSEPRSRVQTPRCSWGGGGDCWQIEGLAVSINSPCVRRGHLGECTIRLGYAPSLKAIAFRRVGSAWGPTQAIIFVLLLYYLGLFSSPLLVSDLGWSFHKPILKLVWSLVSLYYKNRVIQVERTNSACMTSFVVDELYK